MNWKKALIAASLATPLVVVLALGFGHDPRAVPFALRDKVAPAFALPRIGGPSTLSLAELKGKPVVLNFWATWCTACAAQYRVLVDASFRWRSTAEFVGIVYQDTEERTKQYLGERGSPFPQLMDEDSRVALDYGVAGVPETFFIDAQGIIRDKYVGPMGNDELAERLRRIAMTGVQETRR